MTAVSNSSDFTFKGVSFRYKRNKKGNIHTSNLAYGYVKGSELSAFLAVVNYTSGNHGKIMPTQIYRISIQYNRYVEVYLFDNSKMQINSSEHVAKFEI